jgi:hypothetical protein
MDPPKAPPPTSSAVGRGIHRGEATLNPVFADAPISADIQPGPGLRRGEAAIFAADEAARLDTNPRVEVGDDILFTREAGRCREEAEALRTPTQPVLYGAGEALTWDDKADGELGSHAWLIDTLEHPDAISTGAASQRLHVAHEAGVLRPAVDTAQSAQASNSVEKMLCHQMAAAHHVAMHLVTQSHAPGLPPAEVVRFSNAAARQFEVYQSACLVLQKLKTGGTQRILVQQQQVNVGPGGQAVVAGRVGGVSRGRGRKRANGG